MSKVILRHNGFFEKELGRYSISLDFLADEPQDDVKERDGYQMNECSYVKEYLKENPNMKYICSNDIAHIDCINEAIKAFLITLKSKGWIEVMIKK